MAMNLGISSYCLCNKLYSKEWTIFDIMNWAKEHDCTHMEVVPFGLPLFKEAFFAPENHKKNRKQSLRSLRQALFPIISHIRVFSANP